MCVDLHHVSVATSDSATSQIPLLAPLKKAFFSWIDSTLHWVPCAICLHPLMTFSTGYHPQMRRRHLLSAPAVAKLGTCWRPSIPQPGLASRVCSEPFVSASHSCSEQMAESPLTQKFLFCHLNIFNTF